LISLTCFKLLDQILITRIALFELPKNNTTFLHLSQLLFSRRLILFVRTYTALLFFHWAGIQVGINRSLILLLRHIKLIWWMVCACAYAINLVAKQLCFGLLQPRKTELDFSPIVEGF
jgi:hypothetical protein